MAADFNIDTADRCMLRDKDQIGSRCTTLFAGVLPIAAVDALLNAIAVYMRLVEALIAAQHNMPTVQ